MSFRDPTGLNRRPLRDPTDEEFNDVTAEMRNERQRWMALYVLCAGVLMIVIDATIVNVALPSIQEDLGFSQSNLAWVVNAYLIAFGGLLLLAGRLGGRLDRPAGRRRADRGDQLALDLLHQRADRRGDRAARAAAGRRPRRRRPQGRRPHPRRPAAPRRGGWR